MEGWSRDRVRRRSRRALGDAVAQHPDAGHGDRLSRAPCSSKARWPRRDAARPGRSSWSARRGSSAERLAADAQRAGFARASISAPRSSSRPSRSMRAPPAAAARSTSLDRRAFRPVLTGVALIEAIRAAGSGGVRVAAAALRVRARQAAHRHPRGFTRLARGPSNPEHAPRRLPATWPADRRPVRRAARPLPALRLTWPPPPRRCSRHRAGDSDPRLAGARHARVLPSRATWPLVGRVERGDRGAAARALRRPVAAHSTSRDEVLGRLGGTLHGTVMDYPRRGGVLPRRRSTTRRRRARRSARWRSRWRPIRSGMAGPPS